MVGIDIRGKGYGNLWAALNPDLIHYDSKKRTKSSLPQERQKKECSIRVRSYKDQKTKRKANVVLYTAIIDNYDKFIMPEYISDEWDYVLFTDLDIPDDHVFDVRRPDYCNENPARIVRYLKSNPHKFFPEYDYCVWIDANILIKGPHLEKTVEDCVNRNVLFMGCPHPENRENMYQELAACISRKKDNPNILMEQVMRYHKEGFPVESPILAGGLSVRRHNDPQVVAFDELWWNEIENGSCRDQISLMYALWRQGFEYEIFSNLQNIRKHNDYCLFPHSKKYKNFLNRDCLGYNCSERRHLKA